MAAGAGWAPRGSLPTWGSPPSPGVSLRPLPRPPPGRAPDGRVTGRQQLLSSPALSRLGLPTSASLPWSSSPQQGLPPVPACPGSEGTAGGRNEHVSSAQKARCPATCDWSCRESPVSLPSHGTPAGPPACSPGTRGVQEGVGQMPVHPGSALGPASQPPTHGGCLALPQAVTPAPQPARFGLVPLAGSQREQ